MLLRGAFSSVRKQLVFALGCHLSRFTIAMVTLSVLLNAFLGLELNVNNGIFSFSISVLLLVFKYRVEDCKGCQPIFSEMLIA